MKRFFILLSLFASQYALGQQPSSKVNVFVGSSGDHGQMSPGASYPFGMMSIAPQTYPNLHMGYEHNAKQFLGFTHNRMEGVGCQGSGGNILIKPFSGDSSVNQPLLKSTESAGPGFYKVGFENHIAAQFAVYKNTGLEQYTFPAGQNGFYINLSHTLANRFVAEEHTIEGQVLSGWIESGTTCNAGVYRVYYAMQFTKPVQFSNNGEHKLIAKLANGEQYADIRIAFSSVDVVHAKANIGTGTFTQLQQMGTAGWDNLLGRVVVKGDPEREKIFYSFLYRTMQSPYVVSEADGSYRATDGTLQQSKDTVYNGWAIWDNYRTQLPLLSILYPEKYKGMATSIASMYLHGKKDYATNHEPSNTVRTEHAIVVLLDAYRKGYKVDFAKITDSLIAEAGKLDLSHPDKALESSYDLWALSQILTTTGKKDLSAQYLKKALEYKGYWNKDFKDLTKNDIDRMGARGMYQGTIWQYRWFVPFDVKGLKELMGGEETYTKQLDQFFDNDLYNHANEPDIQVPLMYNASAQPWKSQALMHKYAADTVVQYYFNDNSRGIDPFVDRIYTNRPNTYVRTMDDDAGAMAAWYVFAASGFSPACVGWPVYYLNVPLFNSVAFNWPNGKHFNITVQNFTADNRYIQSATLNGKPLTRNWLSHQEIMQGGTLVIVASDKPNKQWGTTGQWVAGMEIK